MLFTYKNKKRNNMQYYLPTYEEARAICEAYDDFQFYESVRYVDGYKVSCFNYRLVGYSDFINPIPERPEIDARELRGLCYVFNTDGTLFARYILMHKFFNVNENVGTQLEGLKHIPIKCVENKLDGSIITFIKLPNGKVYAKSKMVLDSDQAIAAQELYEGNNNIRKCVEVALNAGIIPIFEYVSPKNRIVLKYNTSELILLKLRDNYTGDYLNVGNFLRQHGLNIKSPKILPYKTWDEIIPLRDTVVDAEGWIITLENGMMLKYKSVWYCALHRLMSESIHREDFLIEKVVNEELDDLIASIEVTDTETLELIAGIQNKVLTYLKNTVLEVEVLLEVFNTKYGNNVKNFCLNEPNGKIRTFALIVTNGRDSVLNVVKKDLLQRTYHLLQARKFLATGLL